MFLGLPTFGAGSSGSSGSTLRNSNAIPAAQNSTNGKQCLSVSAALPLSKLDVFMTSVQTHQGYLNGPDQAGKKRLYLVHSEDLTKQSPTGSDTSVPSAATPSSFPASVGNALIFYTNLEAARRSGVTNKFIYAYEVVNDAAEVIDLTVRNTVSGGSDAKNVKLEKPSALDELKRKLQAETGIDFGRNMDVSKMCDGSDEKGTCPAQAIAWEDANIVVLCKGYASRHLQLKAVQAQLENSNGRVIAWSRFVRIGDLEAIKDGTLAQRIAKFFDNSKASTEERMMVERDKGFGLKMLESKDDESKAIDTKATDVPVTLRKNGGGAAAMAASETLAAPFDYSTSDGSTQQQRYAYLSRVSSKPQGKKALGTVFKHWYGLSNRTGDILLHMSRDINSLQQIQNAVNGALIFMSS